MADGVCNIALGKTAYCATLPAAAAALEAPPNLKAAGTDGADGSGPGGPDRGAGGGE